MRLVAPAVDARVDAGESFANEVDLPRDFGEDVAREALEEVGVSAPLVGVE